MTIDNTAPLEGDLTETPETVRDWVDLARQAYRASTEYMSANYRKQWEKNRHNFRSKHAPGSKYHTDKYKYRARFFTPKTRTAVLKAEAAFTSAMFSTEDVVAVEPHDKNNPVAAKEAEIWHSILNYRLTKSLPWFRLAAGAFQEAQVDGAVVSKQEWEHEEEVIGFTVQTWQGQPLLDELGEPVIIPDTKVIKSQPRVRLLEIENVRMSPAADWLNPVDSSPYFIELIPMFVGDVLDYMSLVDPETGEPYWYGYTKEEIAASRKSDEANADSTRTARTGGQTDKYNQEQGVSDFDTVWVHLNFMRVDGGEDIYFYTLGTDKILSDPKPVKDATEFPDGKRPYVLGVCSIEPHRVIPASRVELIEDLQASGNDISNQRRDNVRLVLDKRYIVDRNSTTDLPALERSVPGGVVLTNDVESVKPLETIDVTSSAYEEQNRVNADIDDLSGTFTGGSVATNRQMNETVGGLNLLASSANATTEYILRTFVETWVEPVVRQLISLEQSNEAEEVRKMFIPEGYQMTGEKVDITVNVGFGSTDPQKRLLRIVVAINSLAQTSPRLIARLNDEEVGKEVFGAAGYRDGSRFIGPAQEQGDPEADANAMKLQVEQQKVQLEEKKIMANLQLKREEIAANLELGYAKLQFEFGLTDEEIKLKREELQAKRDIAGIQAMNQQNELAFKADTGRMGI